MRFIDRIEVEGFLAGKSVAVVGSGPGVLQCEPGLVDSHDVVIRVNNYRCTGEATGYRTDVHYSFFGSSIKKTEQELRADGVRMLLCKCPNAKFMESEWHRRNHKEHGVDFRYIYRDRASWWWCDTYVPSIAEFMASFELLGGHIPSTGFSALLLVLSCNPRSVLAAGFDFFASRVHNVCEPWRPGNPDDPIGHAPERERAWLAANRDRHQIQFDPVLADMMRTA